MTECEQVNNQDAGKLIARLVLHFMQKGNEGSPVSALESCVHFVRCSQLREHGMIHSLSPSITGC
jgi:hypothetical protein